MKFLMPLIMVLLGLGSAQAAIVLDFEGLQDLEPILGYYDGGTGGMGSSSSVDYDISFGSNALAIIDADAGGSGNFGGEPSPDTVMFFLTGSAILNMPAGFDTGFSFSYSAITNPGSVVVYDGADATGNVLSTISLPTTKRDGGDPSGAFSPFYEVGVPIFGTARSIDFGGTVNQIGFDNITFGSATPGVEVDLPFLEGDPSSNPGYASSTKVTTEYFDRNTPPTFTFNPEAPTYVITHGWQPSGDYDDRDWDFLGQEQPSTQSQIINGIQNRLAEENVSANIIAFEWEGAYTGGDGLIDELRIKTSREARNNAEYAGILLGTALKDILGDSYDQDLHFIGHSFGTVVNGLATRYLGSNSVLRNTDTIQFTTLDSPTEPLISGFAPALNSDWFVNNLSPEVDYLDNYYGTGLEAFGEALEGAGLNQRTDYSHSRVASVFYRDLIMNGPDANTNQLGPDWPFYAHQFDDWITPLLSTYQGRPGDDFTIANINTWSSAVSSDYQEALGEVTIASYLPGDDYNTYSFNGMFLKEQSPVSFFYLIDIPLEAGLLSFDWMVDTGGDGDWLTVHYGSELLWNMAIDQLLEGTLLNAIIDISSYAGTQGELYFTLNSVGDANAGIYVGNLEFQGSAPVPEPSTVLLLGSGLLGLFWYGRKRKNE